MEFNVGDRVDVVTYPEAELLYSGKVVMVHDESEYHVTGSCECAYDILPETASDVRHVLAAYVVARRRCEACGQAYSATEGADCHSEDHRAKVCRRCDGDFAHVWPKGTLTPES